LDRGNTLDVTVDPDEFVNYDDCPSLPISPTWVPTPSGSEGGKILVISPGFCRVWETDLDQSATTESSIPQIPNLATNAPQGNFGLCFTQRVTVGVFRNP